MRLGCRDSPKPLVHHTASTTRNGEQHEKLYSKGGFCDRWRSCAHGPCILVILTTVIHSRNRWRRGRRWQVWGGEGSDVFGKPRSLPRSTPFYPPPPTLHLSLSLLLSVLHHQLSILPFVPTHSFLLSILPVRPPSNSLRTTRNQTQNIKLHTTSHNTTPITSKPLYIFFIRFSYSICLLTFFFFSGRSLWLHLLGASRN